NYGLLNDVLIRTGVMTERVAWLSSPVLAMPAVILTNVWRGVPFFAIMLLAGLQAIPTELTSTYTLMQAYSNLDFGYAATLSVALLLIMLGFTIFYLRITRGLEST